MPAALSPLNLRNVFWLTLSLLLVMEPHALRIPIWVTLMGFALCSLRLYVAYARLRIPRKSILLFLVVAVTVGVYLNYGTIFGRDSGVALLIIMLSLKLVESATKRDAMIVVFLSYFLIITNFLYSQTIPTAIFMLFAMIIITSTMIGLQHTNARYAYRDVFFLSGTLLAQAIPLMLVLFVLFPRVQGPLWGLPQDAHSGISGLSDTMSPGSISQLGLSDAIAFRVQFSSGVPRHPLLYWRGPVLWDFDGRTWTAAYSANSLHQDPATIPPQPNYQAQGAAVHYAVTLEPHNKRWLFALDLPATIPPRSTITPDFQLLAEAPLRTRARYEISSFPIYNINQVQREEIDRALRIPSGYNPRTHALAQSMLRAARNEQTFVQDVLRLFRNQNFFYTLQPPLLGLDSIDDFLFDTRRGFCEHYASSFAYLMRAAGIPARVVTGYQGGEINTVGNYLIVRQADAHAWVEIWTGERGWVRIDPTAAVSPLRVESGIAAAALATDPLPFIMRTNYLWLRRIRFSWDAVANSWNQWVLGYNPQRQLQLLSRVGLNSVSWKEMTLLLFGITLAIIIAIAYAFIGPSKKSIPKILRQTR